MSARIVNWEPSAGPLGAAFVAMGVFDGVHLGHQALLADTVLRAREHDVLAVALTFDRDPDQVVTPDAAAPQLLSLDDKLQFMEAIGLDAILVIPFCMRLASMEPDRFLDDVLTAAVEPCGVLVGYDFRFGLHASGTVSTLEAYGARADFEVFAHDLVSVNGAPVTSTRIRGLIADGDVRTAAVLLGRHHRLTGRVMHGRGEGAPLLGVPTANVQPRMYAALPADGVYAGYAWVGGERLRGAISVGLAPSFPAARDRLEAHIVGWTGDLYAKDVTLEFVDRIRAQDVFADPEALAQRIHEDIEVVERLLADREEYEDRD